uniref:Uncharacterized protein n=1 Tax=Clastoptera arizonana TaxID=38151 RepID=A0A1B6DZN5_9HEMI
MGKDVVLAVVLLILFNLSFSKSCLKAGEACSTIDECCESYYCVNSTCTYSKCIPEYQLCVPGDKCCGEAECQGDQCLRPCVIGGDCKSNADCCDGADCVDYTGGAPGYCSRLCKNVNEKCDYFKDTCCGNLCKNGKCVPHIMCGQEDQKCNPITKPCCSLLGLYCYNQTCYGQCQYRTFSCKKDEDCCGTLKCENGTCQCSDYGETCHSDRDCCRDKTGDVPRCIHGVCRKPCYNLNSMCKHNSDCCSSYNCEEGLCKEYCKRASLPCKSTADCCDGVCGEKSLCQKKSPCLKLGTKCKKGEQCCLDFCWKGTCQVPCTPIGKICSEDTGDCCDGGYCVNKVCRKKPCTSVRNHCSDDDECCSDYCDEGICKYKCLPEKHSCYSNEACCSGVCKNKTCFTPCLADKQYCLYDHECCDGHCIERSCQYRCSQYKEPCMSAKDCCYTDLCVNGVCGQDCFSEKYFCNNGTDCCSGNCQKGSCGNGQQRKDCNE